MHQDFNENPTILEIPLKDFHSMQLNGKPDLVVAYVQRLLYLKGYRQKIEPKDLSYHIDERKRTIEFRFKNEHRGPDFC